MPRVKKSRLFLFRCALGALSLFFCLVFAEIAARILIPEVSDSFVIKTESLQEKFHHKPLWGTLSPPDPLAYRVVFIGDSFTYGYPIKDRTKAFPAVFGQLFNEGAVEGVEARRIQSYNLGTPSYSPSVYGVVLREITPALKPDMVVLGLDDSDPQDDILYGPMLVTDSRGLPVSVHPGLPGVPHWLKPVASRVKLVRLSLGLGDKAYRKFVDREPQVLKRWESRLGHYRPGPGTEAQWSGAFQRSHALVAAMHDYCEARGIRFCVINYPYPPAVSQTEGLTWRKHFHFGTDQLYEPSFHEATRTFCQSRKIPYYDFTTKLRSLTDHKGLFLSDDDPHYSPEGNAMLARELVRFLGPMIDAPASSDYDRSPGRSDRASSAGPLSGITP